MKRSIVSVMVLLLAGAAGWAEDSSLTPQLLSTVQIGAPQGLTAEQITVLVQNGHATYLDTMLARSALVVLHRDNPAWESFDNLLSSVLNSALNSGNVYPQPRDLHAGFGGKELVFTMVYALVMSGQQERAVGILEQHLSSGSQLKQAIVLQALRNIGTQRAISLIQKYQEKGDYHNLAENTLADQQGVAESDFIGEFEPRAGGQAVRDASDLQSGAGEPLGEVAAGRIALDIGAQGDDDFLNALLAKTFLELSDAQIFRADAIQRGDLSAEHMVLAVKGA